MYAEHLLQQDLHTHAFGRKIYTFDTIDSTNNCAKAVAAVGADEGTVVIAEEQTAGRGRLGRAWTANANENLTFSIVLRPKLAPDEANLIPLYVAVAVAEATERVSGLSVDCKWPNDLLLNKKKFAGILTEGSIKENEVEYVVVGIGINVNQRSFSRELVDKATSLRLAARREINRVTLFRETLMSLERHYNTIYSRGPRTILPRWMSHSSMINKPISVSDHGNVISGIAKGLSTKGGLILQTNGMERTVFAGDVTVVRM